MGLLDESPADVFSWTCLARSQEQNDVMAATFYFSALALLTFSNLLKTQQITIMAITIGWKIKAGVIYCFPAIGISCLHGDPAGLNCRNIH